MAEYLLPCYTALARLAQVILRLAAGAVGAEFLQRLRLDLAKALPRDLEGLAHLLQRPAAAINETETHREDGALSLGQTVEQIFDLFFEPVIARNVTWCLSRPM